MTPFELNPQQITTLWCFLAASMLFLVVPLLWAVLRLVCKKGTLDMRQKYSFNKKLLIFSGFLIGAVWCLRFAVGYYTILADKHAGEVTLEWWEEIFNSLVHSLQTFSMDEDYTAYITDGRQMLMDMGAASGWSIAYGIVASCLNFVAPVAGGAIIFEILANIFPKIRLVLSYAMFWKEKYYFNQLNAGSLTLIKSILQLQPSIWKKPVIVVADPQLDEEAKADLLVSAKVLGAVCIAEELPHIAKNRFGSRKFLLIDEQEEGNLHMLANLADSYNSKFLRDTEVYLFCTGDTYTQVENQVLDKLQTQFQVPTDALPVFIPVPCYRNMITDLLVRVPLYEPLVQKQRNEDGTVDLNVTILGSGEIGTEMFLSTYWFGQILDCKLHINVVSQESEDAFWGRIDRINPEIRMTTQPGHKILQYNRREECSEPYCTVQYFEEDINAKTFQDRLHKKEKNAEILNTDYFLVALGSDVENLTAANLLRRCVGRYHVSQEEELRTVIAYVVYDSDLCATLNQQCRYNSATAKSDVFMQAVGSRDMIYSAQIVFMTEHEALADQAEEAYRKVQKDESLKDIHRARAKDDYKHWANLARGMHFRYKVFSSGVMNTSLFDVDDSEEGKEIYNDALKTAFAEYCRLVSGLDRLEDPEAAERDLRLVHRLSWLEHRRWCAFTRIKGFRCSWDYDSYKGVTGSYKHMGLKLHPCLVECDQRGIRAPLRADYTVEEDKCLQFTKGCPEADPDLLDELSLDLRDNGLNNYDFKLYDYPLIKHH